MCLHVTREEQRNHPICLPLPAKPVLDLFRAAISDLISLRTLNQAHMGSDASSAPKQPLPDGPVTSKQDTVRCSLGSLCLFSK